MSMADAPDAIAAAGAASRPDAVLDRYARLIQRLLNVPVGLVSLLDDEGRLRVGQAGLPDTPFRCSFGLWVLECGQTLVVPDARQDRASGIPPVVDELGVVAFAGVPITDGGPPVGSLCAIDHRPRDWTQNDLDALYDLRAAVVSERRLRLTVTNLTTAQVASEASRLLAESAESRAVGAQLDADEARHRAERSAAQLTLLADASQTLNATLNADEAAARLARLVVPALADWSLVLLTDDDGGYRDVGWAHADPGRQDDVELLARRHEIRDGSVIARVIESGQPEILPRIDRDLLEAASLDPEARAAFARLAPESVTVLPLQERGATFGAIALYADAARDAGSAKQLEIAVEITRRASLAIDNARLYGRQHRVAETLQRSLLSDPPVPHGTDVVARYRAATVDAQIGGDWYDSFLLPDGSMVLVVGDVVGHDVTAAAAMGQIRSLVRGIAYDRGESPAQVLTRVDRAVAGLGLDTLATVIIVRIEPAPDAGGPRLVHWSSAGHPPPVVTDADGVVLPMPDDADLLLGMRPGAHRHNHELSLAPGATLLLYTDGLVERRGAGLDEGLAMLARSFRELHGLPLAGLCDGLLHRLLPREHDDDAALVAVRNLR
jgi:serine phosphatase RsbU (regulator of sigma subunit)